MTWKSHIAIAVAVSVPFSPIAVPFSVLGSTAPDWSEWILKFFGIRVKHRGATHYLYIPLIIMILGLFIHNYLFWFGVGYLTHWFADSLTKSGVPISQFDSHRIHFFGGKLTTGQPMEYIISFGFLFFSMSISQGSIPSYFSDDDPKFNPYWTEYGRLFEDKIIDEKTYKINKFKIF